MRLPKAQIFGIPNCDTMKKARLWLKENNVEFDFHDYKKAGITENTLRSWISMVGWEVLINRRGTTWRKVPQEIKNKIDENIAIDLMIKNPSLIKRPVLKIDNRIEIGFHSDQYAEIFK